MSKPSILVAEDEGVVAQDVAETLTDLGYAVSAVVLSGEEAIEKAGKTHPDLILMDIKLKGKMHGVEAAERIRAHLDIPVVYLTAYADDQTLSYAKVTEPFGYIVKPFERRELHSVIQMALYKHEMEQRLRKSEARFRALVEHASDIVFILDEDGTLRYTSPAIMRVLGYGLSDLTGQALLDLIHPDDLPSVVRVFNSAAQEPGVAISMECRLRHQDGSWRTVESTVNDLIGDTDVGGIVVNARDVTGRKQAERALWQSREWYRSTIDAMDELVYVLDHDLCFVLYNKAFRKFSIELGAGNDLVGEKIFDVFPFLPPKAREEYRWVLETGNPVLVEEPTQMGGFTSWTYARKVPVQDEDGRVYQIVTIASGLLR